MTKNMYVYEYGRDIVVVDCGIGFPDEGMLGIDFVIPDITYLRDKKEKIRGIVLTHGHDDHIAALPYLWSELGRPPVYGTTLTVALAENRMKETGENARFQAVKLEEKLKLGVFGIEFVHMTHSIPDATNLIIRTPVGLIYHGSDFKFDWTPMDNQFPETGKIAKAGSEGVLCLLSDCLRSEKPGYTLSERVIESTLEQEIKDCAGKFIVTTQSSNISRIQQVVNVALRNRRYICFLGRSLDQNVETAEKLGFLLVPKEAVISQEEAKRTQADKVVILAAGSQGQQGSALSRMAHGDERTIGVNPGDVVVFSADPIPGNENAVHSLIDLLSREGARVSYSEVLDDLHVSGHGAANDLMLMASLLRPKYFLPIGGSFRHMTRYGQLIANMGFPAKNVLLPTNGQSIEFNEKGEMKWGERVSVKQIMVDGLGVGDVGNVVLRDRQVMSNDGIVMVIVPVNQDDGTLAGEPDVYSRGFVFVKESGDLIKRAQKVVEECLKDNRGSVLDWQFLRRHIEEALEKFLYEETKRRPMILPVVVEV